MIISARASQCLASRGGGAKGEKQKKKQENRLFKSHKCGINQSGIKCSALLGQKIRNDETGRERVKKIMYCVPPSQKESNCKRSVTPDHAAHPKNPLP